MARPVLFVLFSFILVSMLAVTTYASLDQNILEIGPELTRNPWFHATLVDAYFGFLTFYVWVAYKESGVWRKLVWFLLIMALGNIAMSIYVLVQLQRWDRSKGMDSLLLGGH